MKLMLIIFFPLLFVSTNSAEDLEARMQNAQPRRRRAILFFAFFFKRVLSSYSVPKKKEQNSAIFTLAKAQNKRLCRLSTG